MFVSRRISARLHHVIDSNRGPFSAKSIARTALAGLLAISLSPVPALAQQAADSRVNLVSTVNLGAGDESAGDVITDMLEEGIATDSDTVLAGDPLSDLLEFLGLGSAPDKATIAPSGKYLLLKHTIADASMMHEGETIEEIHASAESAEAMMGQYGSGAELYEFDENQDYYAAFVDVGALNDAAELYDCRFALKDAGGNTVDDAIWDADNGIAYVPKSYYRDDSDPYPVQLQMLYSVDLAAGKANVAMKVTSDGAVEVPAHLRIEEDSLDVTSTIQIATRDTAANIGIDDIHVRVNGQEEPVKLVGGENAVYDAQTGMLTLAASPLSLASLDIEIVKARSLAEKAYADDPLTAADLKKLRGAKIDSLDIENLHVGDVFKASGVRVGYIGNGDPRDTEIINATKRYMYTWYLHPESLYNQIAYNDGISWGNVDDELTVGTDSRILFVTHTIAAPSGTVGGQNWSGFPITATSGGDFAGLALGCSHVANPIGTMAVNATEGDVWWRVLAMKTTGNNPYVVLGFVTDEIVGQSGCGIYKVAIEATGDAKVIKKSDNESITNGNGCYSLKDAVFQLIDSDGDIVDTAKTDEDGVADFDDVSPGTYTVHEKTAPKGYTKAADATVTVVAGETASVTVKDPPLSDPASIAAVKYDGNSGKSEAEGDAQIVGAQFTFRYYDGYYDASNLPSTPTRTWVLRTNDIGQARLENGESLKVSGDDFYYQDGVIHVPLGTLTQTETSAPNGYLLGYVDNAGTFHEPETYITQYVQNGNNVDVKGINYDPEARATQYNTKVDDEPKSGGVRVAKKDREHDDYVEQGAATLEGAKFEIVNRSANPVTVDGREYAVGAVCKTIETSYDSTTKEYVAETGERDLPYGTYEVYEAQSPEGYIYDAESAAWSRTFSIRSDGQVFDYTAVNDACANYVKRGDLSLYKIKATTQRPMGGIPFEIESQTTGEKHVAVTDENGYISTASDWNAHTHNTNANDKAVDDDGIVDETKLDAEAGIWFSGSADKTVAADDDRGALPYDTYTVTELEVEANQGASLLTYSKRITRNGVTLPADTLENDYISIGSSLTTGTGAKTVIAGVETELIDRIGYTNLEDGVEYTIKDSLHFIDENGNDTGVVNSRETTFKAHDIPVEVEVPLTANVDGAEGGKYVACVQLYAADGALLATHDDLDDEGQTVTVPAIGTTLSDAAGNKVVSSAENQTLVDRVTYKGLVPNRRYVLNCVFHQRSASGEDLGETGAVASKTFTPETSSGTVDVETNIEAGQITGTLVAFERLELAGETAAVHEDITDEGQTILVPGITTIASDSVTGTHVGSPDGLPADTASYTGLEVGKSYKIKATLHRRTSAGTDGGIAKDGNGSELVAEQTFTAETSDGTVTVRFDAQPETVTGETFVVFEDVFDGEGNLVAREADISNADQSIRYPSITTAAHAKDSESRTLGAEGTAVIVDTVSYSNLPTGTYTITDTLHATENGKDLGGYSRTKGDPVTETAELTVSTDEDATGSVDVELTVDTTVLEGKSLVAFATLAESTSGAVVARHEDIKASDQTIGVAKVTTTAGDNSSKSHEAKAQDAKTITDTVMYEGLSEGEQYKVVGTLMNRNTGNAAKLEAGADSVTKDFKAKGSSGKVNVQFNLGQEEAVDGSTYVAYEEIQDENGRVVAEHKDPESAAQSVAYRTETPPSVFAKTGRSIIKAWQVICIGAGMCLLALTGYKLHRSRRRYWVAPGIDADTWEV